MSFYKMSRGWMDHPAFGAPEKPRVYTEREAFVWIIENAAWKETVVNLGGVPVKLERGQLSFSIRFMAQRMCWSINRYRGWLKKMETFGILTSKTDTAQTVITVCNYKKYQDGKNKTDTAPDTAPDTKKKELKKLKKIRSKEKKEEVLSSEFDLQSPNPPDGGEVRKAVEIYNSVTNLPKCQVLSEKRKAALKLRLAECGGLEGWKTAMAKVAASAFLHGAGSTGWIADFDFILRKEKFINVMEGKYDDRQSTRPAKQSAHDAMSTGFDQAAAVLERMEGF